MTIGDVIGRKLLCCCCFDRNDGSFLLRCLVHSDYKFGFINLPNAVSVSYINTIKLICCSRGSLFHDSENMTPTKLLLGAPKEGMGKMRTCGLADRQRVICGPKNADFCSDQCVNCGREKCGLTADVKLQVL